MSAPHQNRAERGVHCGIRWASAADEGHWPIGKGVQREGGWRWRVLGDAGGGLPPPPCSGVGSLRSAGGVTGGRLWGGVGDGVHALGACARAAALLRRHPQKETCRRHVAQAVCCSAARSATLNGDINSCRQGQEVGVCDGHGGVMAPTLPPASQAGKTRQALLPSAGLQSCTGCSPSCTVPAGVPTSQVERQQRDVVVLATAAGAAGVAAVHGQGQKRGANAATQGQAQPQVHAAKVPGLRVATLPQLSCILQGVRGVGGQAHQLGHHRLAFQGRGNSTQAARHLAAAASFSCWPSSPGPACHSPPPCAHAAQPTCSRSMGLGGQQGAPRGGSSGAGAALPVPGKAADGCASCAAKPSAQCRPAASGDCGSAGMPQLVMGTKPAGAGTSGCCTPQNVAPAEMGARRPRGERGESHALQRRDKWWSKGVDMQWVGPWSYCWSPAATQGR